MRFFPLAIVAALLCALILTVRADVGDPSTRAHSIARQWNDILLDCIRSDSARPTVHARNLWHTSLAMWNSLVAYKGPNAQGFEFAERASTWVNPPAPGVETATALRETLSYAMYTIIKHRFASSPGVDFVTTTIEDKMVELGYPSNLVEEDGDTPGELGLRIAAGIISFGATDGANEANDYNETVGYQSINPELDVAGLGSPGWEQMDADRYQDLFLTEFVGQSGIEETRFPDFLGPHWGLVTPFALDEDDASCPGGGWNGACVAPVYLDPGAPPSLLSNEYAEHFMEVSVWSGYNDATDGVEWDISPAVTGNNTLGTNSGPGHSVNPVTGLPYASNVVKRGDYTRVLAEFWADGPDSETPPGHWNTILNYVNDQPGSNRKLNGVGIDIEDVEWDILSYFLLNGAVHDCAVAAWSIKGHYDYIRPISAIRYMCEAGQRSDPGLPRYDPRGVVLIPDRVDININNKYPGFPDEAIMVYAWKGVDVNSQTTPLGAGWIDCGNWVPYQRPNFVTPPFAAYVSGHSTFSRAAAEVLTSLTGSEYFPGGLGTFTFVQNEGLVFEEGPSETLELQWATYYDAADECGLSRIYGGIHLTDDDIPGRFIGQQVGFKAIALAQQYFDSVDFTEEDGISPSPSPLPTPTPTPTPVPVPIPPMNEWWKKQGRTIKSFSLKGTPCHGGNSFNSQPISDWQEVAATFENPYWAGFWTSNPGTGGPFSVPEMGVIEPGNFHANGVTASSPDDSLVATWISPAAQGFLGVDPTTPIFQDRMDVPYSQVQSFLTPDVSYSPVSHTDPLGATGQLLATKADRPELTLGDWNCANGRVKLKCYRDRDGVVTGSFSIKAKNMVPNMAYTVWAVSAGTENDSPAPIYATPFGGIPSIIQTDDKGKGEIERTLAYCPLKRKDRIMYIALAAHPDGIIWGSQTYSATNPFPLGGSDHLCFNLGEKDRYYIDV
eukprot:TRINITY_DN156_c0_g1_i2.p1 TRINITY_DN156_c0_g1~~TRINITY_DN156_c0_g1_i2.p1  ORF type:complete len:951 (-),score=268.55 TRINITY_DN156_c0_g1_i2:105-2957(-)